MTAATDTNPPPPRPRVVLRLGFAGRREIDGAQLTNLARALDRVLARLGHRLAALTPGTPLATSAEPLVAAFYDGRRRPLLRLVTGLCEGADTAAALALERLTVTADTAGPHAAAASCIDTELAAVLPFDIARYRASRYDWFQAEFDRQAAACAYIVELDGLHDRPQPAPEPDSPRDRLARRRRARGYRAQSKVLLRQVDLLIAAADPDAAGKAGGTLETIAAALAFALPVVFIHTGDASIRVVDPEQDLASALADPLPTDAALDATLDRLVEQLIADPELAASRTDGGVAVEGLPLLAEFFDAAQTPPAPAHRTFADRLRHWSWRALRERLGTRPRTGASAEDGGDGGDGGFAPEASPFHVYRDRARRLNHHYSGLYRGAFVLGYGLAVAAVLLATLALVLLGQGQSEAAQILKGAADAGHAAAPALAATTATGHAQAVLPDWLVPALLALGFGKLVIVWFIARNTQRANGEQWSDLAVDYRYLAERLRTMLYLPLAGSFQPPAAAPPQYASRVARQSAVDWLFEAILRSVSPAAFGVDETLPGWNGGTLRVRVLRPRPASALAVLREHWVRGQVAYHADNARIMRRLDLFTEQTARRLGSALVAVVVLDLALVAWELRGTLPASIAPTAHLAAPWLMFLAALLPAAVAALSGLRFQSECRRLAERSEHLRRLLGGRPADRHARPPELTGGRWLELATLSQRVDGCTADPDSDIGAWSADALAAAERIAIDCVREVAEWSVLYAKELPET
ncbi:hypothetical protein [Thiohalocapsa sp. ML1]|uniref:hypothetical protein n=1 Tax=Thiohalocapsa sp. ML1 TaxID=1431688 RepID=UPI00073241FD|nr:hypothetical protein [Thiohalocapsa sp. ML1]